MAKYLLEKGAVIDFTNEEGKSALMLAIQTEILPAVAFLLEKGANPHLEDV
jgi:ankyrin repeat protein